jgi:hypothetical protein
MRFGLGGLALAAIASFGCGRLKPAASAGTPPTPDAAAGDVSTSPPASDGSSASDGPSGLALDAAVPRTGRPLPAEVHPPVRFLGAGAALTGFGRSGCTHQTPASGDGHRWCAVTLGAPVGSLGELWVIDVTRAATGDVPTCDGTDSGCLHLTSRVETRSATFFEGDTLFYGTDSSAGPGADFLGRIFAWRPGWTAGRQISSDAGYTCIGNQHSAAAACLDDPGGDPTKRDSANVRAGYLLGQAGGPLPTFGRYPLRNDNDTAWQAALSPDGSVFALSDADTIGAKQTLRLSPTGQVGTTAPRFALDDVSYWQIANDGQKIYFLRSRAPRADLYVADFPSGGNVTLVEAAVRSFVLLGNRPGDQALELVKDRQPGGIIELQSDRAAAAPKTIFTYDDFLNGAVVSPDLRYTTWLNDDFRAVVFRNDDLVTCTIDDAPVFEPSYLEGAALMFWKERSSPAALGSDQRDAFYAPPEGCRRGERFARHVDLVAPVGDRGLVFTDEQDPMTSRVALKYVSTALGAARLDPAGAVRVQDEVAPPVLLVGADSPLLVYSAVGASAETTGLFVFGPVPF